ncbi:Ig-like domain-containing protein [Rhodococcus spongiicola]|uniref:Ig-like domain-containing protein n=1 Tax=Rhodococcus spongiicola TaxID=2487352 RepID=UPI001F20B90A|nr:Ig-like domain-containing protein [Rhodococcus spongiicola]
MQQSRIRRLVAPIGIGAMVAGLTMMGGIPAQAAPVTTSFKTACLATPNTSLAGPEALTETGSVTVDAPTSINAGEEFDVTIQPGPIGFPKDVSIATITNVSRVKIDVYLPDNADFISAEVVPFTSAGLSGVRPNVLRINGNGDEDPNGNILRLSGNNEVIANGPSSSSTSTGGIKVDATGKDIDGTPTSNGYTYFQLPQVKARLKAGESGTIDLKLRTNGDAGKWNHSKNFLTFTAKLSAPVVGTVWAPTKCTPRDKANENEPLNAGAGPLGSVQIIEADRETATTISGPDAAKIDAPVTLTANIDPAPAGGTVEFLDWGNPIGEAEVVDGSASIEHAFDSEGDHAITAVFSGSDGFIGSTSAPKTVTVSSDDVATSIAVVSPDNAYVGQDVNLSAQVTPAVQGGTVEFVVGGQTLTAEVGTDGAAIVPYTFDATGTHRVIARYSGTDGFLGSVSPAFPVSVTNAPPADVLTTTTLAPVGEVPSGSPVTLVATVDPANANGKVQFKLGNAPLGLPVDVVNGVATLPTTFLNAGTYSVTAEFVASAGFVDSASAPQELVVPEPPASPLGSLEGLFGS